MNVVQILHVYMFIMIRGWTYECGADTSEHVDKKNREDSDPSYSHHGLP